MIGFIYRPGLHPQQGDKVVQEVGVFTSRGPMRWVAWKFPRTKPSAGEAPSLPLLISRVNRGRFHARYPITAVEEAHEGNVELAHGYVAGHGYSIPTILPLRKPDLLSFQKSI